MLNKNIWHEIEPGTIPDKDIIKLANSGELIKEGFELQNVKQGCYELRASDLFYETSASRENKRVQVGSNGYVLRPHTYVTAIVKERIELPANVLSRILTKGKLFSIGILPVNTYADPGFQGRLGITLYNSSHRHIIIKPNQSIAKAEFSVLAKPVDRPYSGQHGFETEIWPIPVDLYASKTDLDNANIKPSDISEIEKTHGPVIASIASRLAYYERKVWIQISVTVLGFLALFAIGGEINWIVAVLLGVAANLITNMGMFWIGSRR